jgi:hypothetical protein
MIRAAAVFAVREKEAITPLPRLSDSLAKSARKQADAEQLG